jgi:hypothetical protein
MTGVIPPVSFAAFCSFDPVGQIRPRKLAAIAADANDAGGSGTAPAPVPPAGYSTVISVSQ